MCVRASGWNLLIRDESRTNQAVRVWVCWHTTIAAHCRGNKSWAALIPVTLQTLQGSRDSIKNGNYLFSQKKPPPLCFSTVTASPVSSRVGTPWCLSKRQFWIFTTNRHKLVNRQRTIAIFEYFFLLPAFAIKPIHLVQFSTVLCYLCFHCQRRERHHNSPSVIASDLEPDMLLMDGHSIGPPPAFESVHMERRRRVSFRHQF